MITITHESRYDYLRQCAPEIRITRVEEKGKRGAIYKFETKN